MNTKTLKGIRTAIYCRTATTENGGRKIMAQEESCREYAEKHGANTICSYIDNGRSGLSYDRDALNMLREDVRQSKIDIVLIHDIARLTRCAYQFHQLEQELAHHDVELVVVNWAKDIESNNWQKQKQDLLKALHFPMPAHTYSRKEA